MLFVLSQEIDKPEISQLEILKKKKKSVERKRKLIWEKSIKSKYRCMCVHATCLCARVHVWGGGGATIFSSLLLHSLQEVPEDSGSTVCGLFCSVTRWCCSVHCCCAQPSSGDQSLVVFSELTVKSRTASKQKVGFISHQPICIYTPLFMYHAAFFP